MAARACVCFSHQEDDPWQYKYPKASPFQIRRGAAITGQRGENGCDGLIVLVHHMSQCEGVTSAELRAELLDMFMRGMRPSDGALPELMDLSAETNGVANREE